MSSYLLCIIYPQINVVVFYNNVAPSPSPSPILGRLAICSVDTCNVSLWDVRYPRHNLHTRAEYTRILCTGDAIKWGSQISCDTVYEVVCIISHCQFLCTSDEIDIRIWFGQERTIAELSLQPVSCVMLESESIVMEICL